MKRVTCLLMLLALLLSGCSGAMGRAGPAGNPPGRNGGAELRLGYMPNLTHAQAVLGVADGSLEKAAGVKIQPKVFSAGPAILTALFAGEIDVAYIGPSPAVTGYVRSQGRALRVVAGAASGGAVFVVRQGLDPAKLAGTRLASPGVANTQDVALRYYLEQQGLGPRERGGNVAVTPLPNAEILGLFARGGLDGAWVPEPWGARLTAETGAVIAVDERQLWPGGKFPTTVVIARLDYLEAHPEAVRGLLAGHVALTDWINGHPEEARQKLTAALAKLQGGKALPDQVMADALSRIDFVHDPMEEAVAEQARRAFTLGYLGARRPDLSGLYDLTLLQEVLR